MSSGDLPVSFNQHGDFKCMLPHLTFTYILGISIQDLLLSQQFTFMYQAISQDPCMLWWNMYFLDEKTDIISFIHVFSTWKIKSSRPGSQKLSHYHIVLKYQVCFIVLKWTAQGNNHVFPYTHLSSLVRLP